MKDCAVINLVTQRLDFFGTALSYTEAIRQGDAAAHFVPEPDYVECEPEAATRAVFDLSAEDISALSMQDREDPDIVNDVLALPRAGSFCPAA